MCVERTVRGVLLKAQAHLVVGIPQVLTHTDTMTHPERVKTMVRARTHPGPHLSQWACQPAGSGRPSADPAAGQRLAGPVGRNLPGHRCGPDRLGLTVAEPLRAL